MSASRIILVSLSSFCQKLTNWWKFDQVLTKTILHSFFETRCIFYDMHIFNMCLKTMCSQLSLSDNKHFWVIFVYQGHPVKVKITGAKAHTSMITRWYTIDQKDSLLLINLRLMLLSPLSGMHLSILPFFQWDSR